MEFIQEIWDISQKKKKFECIQRKHKGIKQINYVCKNEILHIPVKS